MPRRSNLKHSDSEEENPPFESKRESRLGRVNLNNSPTKRHSNRLNLVQPSNSYNNIEMEIDGVQDHIFMPENNPHQTDSFDISPFQSFSERPDLEFKKYFDD